MSAFSRRRLLQAAAAGSLSGVAAAEVSLQAAPDLDLQGVCDIHLHAAPDSRERSVTELGIARKAKAAGFRALLFKSNDFASHDRAFLVAEATRFDCFGSVSLNRIFGPRVSPWVVEKALATTGSRCRAVWLPTQDSVWQRRHENRTEGAVPVLGADGKVLPEVARVMDLCAEADIIFASGHSSPEETLVLAAEAKARGVRKFVATHVNSLIWTMTQAQIERAAELGVWIECCWLPCVWGPGSAMPDYPKESHGEFAKFLRVAPERTFISTDLGQKGLPDPVDGMKLCIRTLREEGFSAEDVDRFVKTNPAHLLGFS